MPEEVSSFSGYFFVCYNCDRASNCHEQRVWFSCLICLYLKSFEICLINSSWYVIWRKYFWTLLKGIYGFPLYLRNPLEPAFFPVCPKGNCGAYLDSLQPCKEVLGCAYNIGKKELKLHGWINEEKMEKNIQQYNQSLNSHKFLNI